MIVDWPREPAEALALAAALLVLLFAAPLLRASTRAFVLTTAVAAAALSLAYVAVYLRGGPRIIDATTYFLEGRLLAHGHFTLPLGEPAASTMGRFLVRPAGEPGVAAGIFPPGFPAILALGFLAGAPLAVGPVIAAGLVVATYFVARGAGADDPTARVAALLSVVCGALRYHTADTMAHGLAALCFASAIALFWRARDAEGPAATRLALGAGFAAGWLAATRPATFLALAATLGVAFWMERARPRGRVLVALGVGALPGFALLLAHQHAATGAWFASSQRLYYANADGPPGCFAYGFGRVVGCRFEHGDFVRAHLEEGYGLVAALGTTLRRLKMHALDVANAEPLALLVPAALWLDRRRRTRALGAAVVAQIACVAPFYFDGNYPGGGARLLADVLPLEHALAAMAWCALAARTKRGTPEVRALAVVALALVGFALRAGIGHRQLRDRDGGRPMFSPAGVAPGLLFVDTDHGFGLAYGADPRVDVVRGRGEALDRLAWEARGRPPAQRYTFDFAAGAARVDEIFFPAAAPSRLVVEAEALWPALAQRDAWAVPAFAAPPCASDGRRLAVHPAGPAPTISLALPAALGDHALSPELAIGAASASVTVLADGVIAATWRVAPSAVGAVRCEVLTPQPVPAARSLTITLTLRIADEDENKNASKDVLLALDRVVATRIRR